MITFAVIVLWVAFLLFCAQFEKLQMDSLLQFNRAECEEFIRKQCPVVPEVAAQRYSVKFLKLSKFNGKHLCQSIFLIKWQPETCNFIKKEILAQGFSCKCCEIFKNNFCYRSPPVAASVIFKVGEVTQEVWCPLYQIPVCIWICFKSILWQHPQYI